MPRLALRSTTLLLALLLAACSPAPAPTLAVEPEAVTLEIGARRRFTATRSDGTTVPLVWEATGGSVAVDGDGSAGTATYTAPDLAGAYTLSVAERAAPARRVEASVTVRGTLTVESEADAVVVGGELALGAELRGHEDDRLAWTASGGSIAGSGASVRWIAPDEPGRYTVRAASVADPDLSAEIEVEAVAGAPVLTGPTPVRLDLAGEGGEALRAAFTLGNAGTASLAVALEITEDETDSLALDRRSFTLAPGAEREVGVEATCPAEDGDYEATVSVTSAGATLAALPVAVACRSGFDIEVVFGREVTDAQRAMFRSAARRWSRAIGGDLPSAHVVKDTNACGQGEPAFDDVVDDVVVFASVQPIDGAGDILGYAGPCLLRTTTSLPVYGTMRFDEADVEDLGDDFETVILHEMGHVLGLGVLWRRPPDFDLLDFTPSGNPSSACAYTPSFAEPPRFTGATARVEYGALLGGPAADVPVEDQGGAGTQCAHWDEETFDHELMTGFLNGGSNPLSRVSLASLDDLGYEVDLDEADAYTLPACSPSCLRASATPLPIAARERLLAPVGTAPPAP